MSILSETILGQLRELFQDRMSGEVKVTLFTQRESPLIIPGRECATCRETGELLREVTSLSEKLQLEVHDFYGERGRAAEVGVDRIPAFWLEGNARGKVRFFGIPVGLEFPSFIDDLLDVSRGTTLLADSSRIALGAFTKDVHLQVFSTPM